MKTKDLDRYIFPVRKVPITDLLPDMDYNPQQEFAIVGNINGKDTLINTCSKQYHLLDNATIIEPLQKFLKKNKIKYELKARSRFNARFYFEVILPEIMVKVGDDKITAKITINNSYDGRVKYSYNGGLFRMICSNGMVIPAEGYEEYNTKILMRHTPSLDQKMQEESLDQILQSFTDNMSKFAEPIKQLNSQKVNNLEERLEYVLDSTKFPKRQAEMVADTILKEQEDLKLKAPTDWLVYNGFNYELNHNTDIKMDYHKKERIDQSIMTSLLG